VGVIAALVNSFTRVLAGTLVAPLPSRIATTEGAALASDEVRVN
jgi:hypothetical protein